MRVVIGSINPYDGRFQPLHRVTQTRTGPLGNCVAAAYATLFGVDIDEVPELHSRVVNNGETQADLEAAWLRSKGYRMVVVPPTTQIRADVCHLTSGTSPRGRSHRVVSRGGRIVHDPHPDGGGLVDVRYHLVIVPA